jgi:hypothetical protein
MVQRDAVAAQDGAGLAADGDGDQHALLDFQHHVDQLGLGELPYPDAHGCHAWRALRSRSVPVTR